MQYYQVNDKFKLVIKFFLSIILYINTMANIQKINKNLKTVNLNNYNKCYRSEMSLLP